MIQLDLRSFLRGLGVSIALPAFDSLHAANENRTNANADRFVCVSPKYPMNPLRAFESWVNAQCATTPQEQRVSRSDSRIT